MYPQEIIPVSPLTAQTDDLNPVVTYRAEAYDALGNSISATRHYATPRDALLSLEQQLAYNIGQELTVQLWVRSAGSEQLIFTNSAQVHLVIGDGLTPLDNLYASAAIKNSPAFPVNALTPTPMPYGASCNCEDCNPTVSEAETEEPVLPTELAPILSALSSAGVDDIVIVMVGSE